MNGFSEYFTSLKLKWNNSDPSLFPIVQKCQFLDSMCFRVGVRCISSHSEAFTVVFSAKGKSISANYQFRGFYAKLNIILKEKDGHRIYWKFEKWQPKQCHLHFRHLWVVYFPSNPPFAWYLVILNGSVYFWCLKLTFFPAFDWTGPQNRQKYPFLLLYWEVDILNRLYYPPKNVFLHPMMHFSTYVGSEFWFVWIVILKEHTWQQRDITSKCFFLRIASYRTCTPSHDSIFCVHLSKKVGSMNVCENWKLM